MKQGSKEWHKQRENKITASRIACILGRGFISREKLMQEFINTYKSLPPEEVSDFVQALFDWGNDNEPKARIEYEKQTGYMVTEVGYQAHPEYDFIGCSADGLVLNGSHLECGVELKCPATWKKNGLPDAPDQKYLDQCQLSMEVYNVDHWDLFYWSPEDTRLFHVDRDGLWWEEALSASKSFWQEYNQRKDGHMAGFEKLTEEYVYLKKEEKIIADRVKAIQKVLTSACDPERNTDFGDVVASHVIRKGAVDNKQVYELLDAFNIDVEDYRKPETSYIKFTIKEKS